MIRMRRINQESEAIVARRACLTGFVATMMFLACCNDGRHATREKDGGAPSATEATPQPAPTDLPVVVSTGQKIDRVTLENGLIIEDIRRGTGQICLPNSVIRAKYSCRVVGGKVFDSTGPDAVQYDLPTMIRGWQDGMPGMQVGGTRRLIVPPELAYGDRPLRDGSGNIVAPANSTLEYVIDLVEVK